MELFLLEKRFSRKKENIKKIRQTSHSFKTYPFLLFKRIALSENMKRKRGGSFGEKLKKSIKTVAQCRKNFKGDSSVTISFEDTVKLRKTHEQLSFASLGTLRNLGVKSV